MCGSDEGNIRMWKSVAWRKEGNLNFRQRASQNYADKLKQKFKHHPEIKRIARHRHVPKVCTILKNKLRCLFLMVISSEFRMKIFWRRHKSRDLPINRKLSVFERFL